VNELELQLQALGRELAFPPAPDLVGRVRAATARPRRASWRRPLVIALAALAVAVGAVLAVPDARSTILRWIGIGSVRVELVDELPDVPVRTTLPLGEEVSRAEARRLFGRPLLRPRLDDLGEPDAVYFGLGPGGTRVTYLWGAREKPKLLLQQFRGAVDAGLGKKVVQDKKTARGTSVRFATVNGRPALGLFGEPHFLMYLDPRTGEPVEDQVYLAGNVLLWESGDLTLRLEGDLEFAEMLRIARRTR
jgi:hypothetical protein